MVPRPAEVRPSLGPRARASGDPRAVARAPRKGFFFAPPSFLIGS